MTAGDRSNSSGAGVSSLLSGSSANDRVVKVNHFIDTEIKVHHKYDTKIEVHHSTHSSAGAHHSDGAANTGDVNSVGSSVGESEHD